MQNRDPDSTEPAGHTGLAAVLDRIAAAESSAGSQPGSTTLVAVSKTFGPEAIEPVLKAGHRVFGENRVQEAQGKWPDLRQRFSDVQLHLIGPLQSNKAGDAVALFDCIETVDRPKIAAELARQMRKQDRFLSCFIQINTGEEPQKAGIIPAHADDFIRRCQQDHGLNIRGLMCIPPVDEEPSLHFAFLEKIARRNGLDALSMGMSADFEVAIAFGATHVRVGSALFGNRPPFSADR